MLRNRFGRFFLTNVGWVWPILAAGVCVASVAAATEISEKNAEKSVASRIVLLEFAANGDSNCERTKPLLDEMRRKNYPIRRVERDASGPDLFRRYSIKTVPTFVLLVDDSEIDRCVAQGESDAILRNQLLRLFQRGREELASRSGESSKSSGANAETTNVADGLISKLTGSNAAPSELVRGQLPDRTSGVDLAAFDASIGGGFDGYSRPAPNESGNSRRDSASVSVPKSVQNSRSVATRTSTLPPVVSNAASGTSVVSALDAATIRVAVGNAANVGSGVVVHFNSSCGEALAVASGSLWSGASDGGAAPVSVDVADGTTGRTTTVPGVVVFCDSETDVAFVAFNVPNGLNVRPAAFLPENEALQVGETATRSVRGADGATQTFQHRILSLDRVPFSPKSGAAPRFSFRFIEVSNAPESDSRGAGLFVERSGRVYLAGVCVSDAASRDAGLVSPLALVAQTLQVRENLAVVYRDQLAGKFDVAAPSVDGRSPERADDLAAVVGSVDSFDVSAPSKNVRAGRVDAASRRIRSTNYEPKVAANSTQIFAASNADGAANKSDAELFEASLDALRRRRLEGAEIICVVNWGDDPNAETRRETEVLRLPRRGENSDLPAATVPEVGAAQPGANAETSVPRGVVRASSTFPETNFLR